MIRVENWDCALVSLAGELSGQPFEWGKTDCASLVRRSLVTILGEDPWKGHVGTWTTKRGALRVLSGLKPSATLKASGAVKIGNLFATTGDVVLGGYVGVSGPLQLAVILPSRKALTACIDDGVVIRDIVGTAKGTRFWRYG